MPALFCTVPFSVLTLLPLTGRSFGSAANIIGMTVPLIPATDPVIVLLRMPMFDYGLMAHLLSFEMQIPQDPV